MDAKDNELNKEASWITREKELGKGGCDYLLQIQGLA